MRTRNHDRGGMTAIEVLAATVLSSLMLASVMGVMGSLVRQQKVLRSRELTPPWHQHFCDQLLWDLQNSRSYGIAPNRVKLEGFAGLDFATGRPTGQATEIEYYLLESESDRFLMRRESHLEALSNETWRTEVVCRGVDRFELGPAATDEMTMATSDSSRKTSPVITQLPARIAARLYLLGSEAPAIDQEIIIR